MKAQIITNQRCIKRLKQNLKFVKIRKMYSPERFDFNQGQQVTIYKVQEQELALEKAMENITELQNNLQFMIKYNEELKQEQAKEQKKSTKMIQELQNILTKKDKEIALLKQKHNQYEIILSDTKGALDQCKQTIIEKQEHLERFERIIHEQKTTIASLQDEILNSKYNEVSIQSNQSGFLQIEELEKQLEEMKYQHKRSVTIAEKESKRAIQLEKQSTQFKNWLGEMVGVRKVVTGCEKILMNEIAKKLGVLM